MKTEFKKGDEFEKRSPFDMRNSL